jgi:hypothetical protein
MSTSQAPTLLVATIGMEYVAPARMPRELKAAGFRVAMLAPEGAWATRTQYIDMLSHIPQRASLATWADVMLQLKQRIDPAFVLPGDDATMRALMTIAATTPVDVPPATRDAILPLITRSLGDPAHYLASVDKAGLVDIARHAGVDVPPGASVDGVDGALRVARELGYPLIVRPTVGTAGRGVSVCNDAAALRAAFAALPTATRWTQSSAPALVQRVLTGARYNRAFVAWQGREVAGYTREAIERWPNALGAASVTRFVTDAGVAAANARLAQAIGISGFAGATYIVDTGSGRPCLIEINRRIVPATHAGRLAGVDLAAAFMSAVREDAWTGPVDTPAELQRTIALFPQEWLRDRSGAGFTRWPVDAPWDDPRLFAAMLGATM